MELFHCSLINHNGVHRDGLTCTLPYQQQLARHEQHRQCIIANAIVSLVAGISLLQKLVVTAHESFGPRTQFVVFS